MYYSIIKKKRFVRKVLAIRFVVLGGQQRTFNLLREVRAFLIVLLHSFNKVSPFSLVDVHMICLIGETTLNYVLAFSTSGYLISFSSSRCTTIRLFFFRCIDLNNWYQNIPVCCNNTTCQPLLHIGAGIYVTRTLPSWSPVLSEMCPTHVSCVFLRIYHVSVCYTISMLSCPCNMGWYVWSTCSPLFLLKRVWPVHVGVGRDVILQA